MVFRHAPATQLQCRAGLHSCVHLRQLSTDHPHGLVTDHRHSKYIQLACMLEHISNYICVCVPTIVVHRRTPTHWMTYCTRYHYAFHGVFRFLNKPHSVASWEGLGRLSTTTKCLELSPVEHCLTPDLRTARRTRTEYCASSSQSWQPVSRWGLGARRVRHILL